LSSIFGGIMAFVAVKPELRALRPNPAFKPTLYGRRPWPRGALGYAAPRGQGHPPPRAA
jgi:hypothetical protein